MRHVIMHPCIMVLAAGRSSRLGRPKQLLTFRGRSMIGHTVDTALESGIGPVCVVTGAFAERLGAALSGSDALVLFNEDWEEGMASSIRKAVSAIATIKPMPDGILFMVCDQPFVNVQLLRELAALKGDKGAKNIIQRHLQETELIPFPQGGLDIDTESDYLELINKAKGGMA